MEWPLVLVWKGIKQKVSYLPSTHKKSDESAQMEQPLLSEVLQHMMTKMQTFYHLLLTAGGIYGDIACKSHQDTPAQYWGLQPTQQEGEGKFKRSWY